MVDFDDLITKIYQDPGDPHALHDLFVATTDMLNANGQKIPGSVVEYCQAMHDRYMPPSETLESANL